TDFGRSHGLALTREGGHSRARIVHAGGDASGAAVDQALIRAVRRSPVRVIEHAVALDALQDATGTVVGVSAARVEAGGRLVPGEVRARAVVLATGGLGQAWASTTNPAGATGDGLALALRAGAELRDVELVQFHPTVLWRGPAARGRQPLVSEAVRGEGAVLLDAAGDRVMSGVHPLGDLAPRDVVAAAMHRRMAEAPGGLTTHLFLDATGLGRRVLEHRFPTVLAACRAAGVDPVTEPIPVAPGAHYACGGVRADLAGRTSVPGLYAVGEVASTGVHGANRLASNSVTEALLAGRRAGELLAARLPCGNEPVPGTGGPTVAAASRAVTAAATSRDAGVLRSPAGLDRLLAHLEAVPQAPPEEPTLQHVAATALHTVSTLVTVAAQARRESRGCHRRTDVPAPSPRWQRHVTLRLDGDRLQVGSPARESAA
ncbi:MAG: L-aspartate oxidase, partial [Actinomycetes bacterium]